MLRSVLTRRKSPTSRDRPDGSGDSKPSESRIEQIERITQISKQSSHGVAGLMFQSVTAAPISYAPKGWLDYLTPPPTENGRELTTSGRYPTLVPR